MGRPMRELHAWRGDGRHVRDAAADAPATRPHDSPKLEVLRDPAVRISKQLEYRKIVEAYEAKHAAGQLKPQEAKPEAASPESRDKPVSKIADGSKPVGWQREDRRNPERSWLPTNETAQMVAGIGIAFSSVAD